MIRSNSTRKFLFSDQIKIIGVDFDNTLTILDRTQVIEQPNGSYIFPPSSPNFKVIKLIKKLITNGKKVHVVTFRHKKYGEEVVQFCKDHDIAIEGVIHTTGSIKTPFLKEIKADCHIDDDLGACILLFQDGTIEPILVMDKLNKKNSSSDIILYKL